MWQKTISFRNSEFMYYQSSGEYYIDIRYNYYTSDERYLTSFAV